MSFPLLACQSHRFHRRPQARLPCVNTGKAPHVDRCVKSPLDHALVFAEIITSWQIPRLEDSAAAESHAKQRKKLVTVCPLGTWLSRGAASGERPLRQKTASACCFCHTLCSLRWGLSSPGSSASDVPGEGFTLLFWTDTGVRPLVAYYPAAHWWPKFRGPSGARAGPPQQGHGGGLLQHCRSPVPR